MFDNKRREITFLFVIFLAPFRFITLWLSLFMLVGCATLGNTLNTQVVGIGNAVTLTWDSQHPLAKHLQSDLNVRLRAEYRVGGKLMSEVLASSKGNAERRVTFVLPGKLKSIPEGEVCLYIQPSRGVSILPIRSVSASQVDTGGFRYLTWEVSLRESMQLQRSANMRSMLERELQSIRERIKNSEQVLLKKGIKKQEDCAQIALPMTQQLVKEERPVDVVDIKQHNAVAKKVCVRQARNLRRISALDISNLMSIYAKEASVLLARRNQAKEFLQDWDRWFSATGVGYQPEIGGADTYLPLVSSTEGLVSKLMKGHDLNKVEIGALVGGILDAYDGCVEDTRKQLRTKLMAWEKQLHSKPERDREYIEYVKQECQKQVEDNQMLVTRAAELQQQIENQNSEAMKPQASSSEQHSQILNMQACGVQ